MTGDQQSVINSLPVLKVVVGLFLQSFPPLCLSLSFSLSSRVCVRVVSIAVVKSISIGIKELQV